MGGFDERYCAVVRLGCAMLMHVLTRAWFVAWLCVEARGDSHQMRVAR